MALIMTDEQRIQALSAYEPAKHLIKIKSKDGQLRDYYPSPWRLYELQLRYPNANFESSLLFFDVEHNLCIVKVRLYLGADYGLSEKKTEALKSGPLSSLDKVETAAKARAARDFGISVEYALDTEIDDLPPGATEPAQQRVISNGIRPLPQRTGNYASSNR